MKAFFSFCFALLLTGTLFAQSKQETISALAPAVTATETKAQTSGGAGPVMTLEVTEIDYGQIEQGSEPLRIFMFKNTGTEPLTINSAHGSCGCTVPNYPKEPIAPGETGKIEVRYDTNRLGAFQKTVTLNTNETENAVHVLKIKGNVSPKPAEQTTPENK